MSWLESLWHFFEVDPVLIATATTLLVALVGWLVGRGGKGRLRRDMVDLEHELARAKAHGKEQSRIVSRLRSEQGTVASLALSIPSVVREMNSFGFNQRCVPDLVLQMAESIFQPAQLLFYKTEVTSSAHGDQKQLRLISHKGLGEPPQSLRQIAFGHGKIGWAAENRVDMLREGWTNLRRIEGIVIEDNHPMMESDIIGPLMQSTPEGDMVLGILCIGAPSVRPRNEKLMFQLVTHLGSLAMVTAQQKAQLADQANHDGLTGLLNKLSFQRRLGDMILAAERAGESVGLFLFDLDYFKTYNDTNGHNAGDELLRELGRLLRECVRPDDLCCRWGGEEFIVAMPATDGPEAEQAAERIRSAIEEYPFDNKEKQPEGSVTISGGIALGPYDGSDATTLTRNADEALYRSKHDGRNRVTRYRGTQIGSTDEEDHLVPVPDVVP